MRAPCVRRHSEGGSGDDSCGDSCYLRPTGLRLPAGAFGATRTIPPEVTAIGRSLGTAGDIRCDGVANQELQDARDGIIKVTASTRSVGPEPAHLRTEFACWTANGTVFLGTDRPPVFGQRFRCARNVGVVDRRRSGGFVTITMGWRCSNQMLRRAGGSQAVRHSAEPALCVGAAARRDPRSWMLCQGRDTGPDTCVPSWRP